MAVLCAAGLLALGACGSSDPAAKDAAATPTSSAAPSGDASSAAPSPSPTPTPTPRDPLAEAVEDLAPSDLPPVAPPAQAPAPQDGEVLGADVSWPQCPAGMGIPQKKSHGAPMPIPEAQYVVIGLTNGPGFYPNPCLAGQVAWVRDRHLMAAAYAVVSYPEDRHLREHGRNGPFDAGTREGRLANVGYQQARYNVASMQQAGLRTPIVWIDVEPVPDFEWTGDLAANGAVVTGTAQGYRDAGYAIGVYSTPALWDVVVGDLALGVPEWRAAGQTSRDEARSRCGPDWVIQGGESVLGQWVEADRDQNITCPGVAADLARWFHQY